MADDGIVVVRTDGGIGVAAYMIQHAAGGLELVSFDGAVRVRGESWDAIWQEFIRLAAPEKDHG